MHVFVPTSCMYVCMHACMHACMYIYIYIYIYVCVCMCLYVCMYVCADVWMYPHIYFSICVYEREREGAYCACYMQAVCQASMYVRMFVGSLVNGHMHIMPLMPVKACICIGICLYI